MTLVISRLPPHPELSLPSLFVGKAITAWLGDENHYPYHRLNVDTVVDP